MTPRKVRKECKACNGNGFLENGDGTTRGCSYCGGNEGLGDDRGRDGAGYVEDDPATDVDDPERVEQWNAFVAERTDQTRPEGAS